MFMRKALGHFIDKTTNNDDSDLVTLPYDILLKQLCAVQPHELLVQAHVVNSSHSSVCKVTSR